jgi:hypothetical protein
MKIAVCYRGFLRTISQTFENHKEKLFKDHSVDFFVHTWNQYSDEIDFVKTQIKPKSILVEDFKNLEINPYNTIRFNEIGLHQNFKKDKKLSDGVFHSRPYNTLSMLYSSMIVNSLRKQYSSDYDLVISVRPDIIFYDKLDLFEVKKNQLNISWFENIGDHLNHGDSVIDHIAIGDSEVIDKYSDCFLYVPAYYFNLGVSLVPEILLGYHSKRKCELSVNMLNARHSVIRIENYNQNKNIDL